MPLGDFGVSVLNWPLDKPNPQEFWGYQGLNFTLNAIGTGQILIEAPSGCMMKILGLDFSAHNTDAAFPVGVIVMFTDESNHQIAEIFAPVLAKGQTGYFSYWLGGRVFQQPGATFFFNHALPEFPIRSGYRVQFFIDNNVITDFTTRLYYYQYTYQR